MSERGNQAVDGRVASESLATRVRLIFAGWLPQDGLFGWKRPQL